MTVGMNLTDMLRVYKPSFEWSAVGGSRVPCTITDIDSCTDPFSVWMDGRERFEVVDPATEPTKVLGSVGDFADGKTSNFWSTSWLTANLGFAVTAPTTSAMLGQVSGTPADIVVGGTQPDVTFIDTTEAQASVIERSNSLSATYRRVAQFLVKSLDGNSPVGNVAIGMNLTAGTRTTDSVNTIYRELPGSRGWWAVMMVVGTGTTNYITLSFAQGSGRWYLAAPMFYNAYATFENIVRAPIPRYSASAERGQWRVSTTNAEFSIPTAGWLAGCLTLPDRSVSNGHVDYDGAAAYGFCGLLTWVCGTYRIRMFLSSTLHYLVIQFDNGGASFSFMDFSGDWDDFAGMGFVLTWGLSKGTPFVSLYVNGEKLDSIFGASDWFPTALPASIVYIGADGSGGASADCWISRMFIGRSPMDRVDARVLSSALMQYIRGNR